MHDLTSCLYTTTECRDLELGCEHWAFKTNYCEGSIYSKWMAKNCRLSCKLCTKCATYQQSSTKVPTTARPTTEPNVYLTSSNVRCYECYI